MPEGPEVKIIAEQLNELLSGKILDSTHILSGKYCQNLTLLNYREFKNSLPLQIIEVSSKGKLIFFKFINGWYLFNSLGMSGTWTQKKVNHCHLQFDFSNPNNQDKKQKQSQLQQQIWFYDMRRFGNLQFSQDRDFISQRLSAIGPDMLSHPPSQQQFIDIFRKKNNWNICKALMEQSLVSGCGNYLKSETLYQAKVSPLYKVIELSDEQLGHIYLALKDLIKKSYHMQGTTLATYKQVDGNKGNFSQFLKVYQKKEDPLGHKVERIKTPDQRSTFWVPVIQK